MLSTTRLLPSLRRLNASPTPFLGMRFKSGTEAKENWWTSATWWGAAGAIAGEHDSASLTAPTVYCWHH